VEGYVESAAMGLLAGRFAAAERLGRPISPPPPETALGALIAHVTGGHLEDASGKARSFQPMNINYGLLPPIADPPKRDGEGRRLQPAERGKTKKRAMSERALAALKGWLGADETPSPLAGEGGDPALLGRMRGLSTVDLGDR
jgi:methylenetetrahydrofolate--tRNA-(uracil-5-)-methyltransferase